MSSSAKQTQYDYDGNKSMTTTVLVGREGSDDGDGESDADVDTTTANNEDLDDLMKSSIKQDELILLKEHDKDEQISSINENPIEEQRGTSTTHDDDDVDATATPTEVSVPLEEGPTTSTTHDSTVTASSSTTACYAIHPMKGILNGPVLFFGFQDIKTFVEYVATAGAQTQPSEQKDSHGIDVGRSNHQLNDGYASNIVSRKFDTVQDALIDIGKAKSSLPQLPVPADVVVVAAPSTPPPANTSPPAFSHNNTNRQQQKPPTPYYHYQNSNYWQQPQRYPPFSLPPYTMAQRGQYYYNPGPSWSSYYLNQFNSLHPPPPHHRQHSQQRQQEQEQLDAKTEAIAAAARASPQQIPKTVATTFTSGPEATPTGKIMSASSTTRSSSTDPKQHVDFYGSDNENHIDDNFDDKDDDSDSEPDLGVIFARAKKKAKLAARKSVPKESSNVTEAAVATTAATQTKMAARKSVPVPKTKNVYDNVNAVAEPKTNNMCRRSYNQNVAAPMSGTVARPSIGYHNYYNKNLAAAASGIAPQSSNGYNYYSNKNMAAATSGMALQSNNGYSYYYNRNMATAMPGKTANNATNTRVNTLRKPPAKPVWEGRPTDKLAGVEFDWPEGWIKRTFQRHSGKNAGRRYSYWCSPSGCKLRSTIEVRKFMKALVLYKGDEKKAFETLHKIEL